MTVLRVCMISHLIYLVRMIPFVRTWYLHLPVCVMYLLLYCRLSRCAAVCHTRTARRRLCPTAPSTRLNVNRQLLEWITLHTQSSCHLLYLRCGNRCLFMFSFSLVIPGILCSLFVYVLFCLRIVDWDGLSVASIACMQGFRSFGPLHFLLLG